MVLIVGITITITSCEDEFDLSEDINENISLVDNRGNNPDESSDNQNSDLCKCLLDQYEIEELSNNERVAILFMREEEKLARDVYAFLYELWDYKIFENIAESESRHMEAMACLITKYNLDDPIQEDVAGVFENAELGSLFSALTEKGALSLGDALYVGAKIEDLDIADLLAHLEDEEIDNKDIKAVFSELIKGSRNHMRAFIRNLERLSLAYSVEFITQDYYDELIQTDFESGQSICGVLNNCQCKGTGQSNNQNIQNGNCNDSCDGSGINNNTGGNGNHGNSGNNGNTGGNGNNGNNGNTGGNGNNGGNGGN